MRRIVWILVALLAVVGFAALPVLMAQKQAVTAAELKAARKTADSAVAEADLAVQAGVRLWAQADSADERAAASGARADSLQHEYSAARRKFQVAALQAPDSCVQVVQAALDALVGADSVIDAEHVATLAAQEAARSYRLRGDTLESALVRLRASSVALGIAAEHVEHSTHASFLSRILPRPGAGVAAGVDALGQPRIIVGVTFGWSF